MITAEKLSKSGGKGKILDSVVREQLSIIDDRLLRHERMWGRNVLAYELPTDFNVPGLARSDAQRIVYSAVLLSLEERGFDTKIVLMDQIMLYIAWTTDVTSKMIDEMNAVIMRHRITPNDIDRFVTNGELAPKKPTTPKEPDSGNQSDRV